MTESQWLSSDDSVAMLLALTSGGRLISRLDGETHLQDLAPPRISDRKARLFACACWRVWLPHAPTGRKTNDPRELLDAIEAIERHVDGVGSLPVNEYTVCHHDAIRSATASARDAARVVSGSAMAVLLRDIVGNPFAALPFAALRTCPACHGRRKALFVIVPPPTPLIRWVDGPSTMQKYQQEERPCPTCAGTGRVRTRRIDPAWLAWDGGTVRHMAESIYAGLAFGRERLDTGGRMPVLGDALEEAGCADWDLLAHLRGLGEVCATCLEGPARKKCPDCFEGRRQSTAPHVRGCWALDLLLGKE